MALTMRQPADSPVDRETFRRFEALFAVELDELRRVADARDVSLEAVAEVYFAIVDGDGTMIKHSDLQEQVDHSDVWNTASVLVDFGEVYRSKHEHWWWIVASEFLADRCEQRAISLKKYMEMQPILRSFQDRVIRWYQTRHMHGNLQTETMREIKIQYGSRLQAEHYPDKPLDPDTFHQHPVSRYLKTAQDEIVQALDLSY